MTEKGGARKLAAATTHSEPDDSEFIVQGTWGELRKVVAGVVAKTVANLAVEQQRTPAPELVPAAEMCRQIGVSRTTLHRMRKAGAPAVRVGDHFRYRPSAVFEWLERRERRL